MEQTIKIIGHIHSPLKSVEDCPLQENENAPEASLQILPAFAKGARDITPGETILLLTWLHKADRSVISCYPRNNREAPHVGVFSTRSPDRPNPIGIHTVKVLSVSGDGLIKVSGLEVIDQTPLLDIKPLWNMPVLP
jgi:tRNA-Thr(GGU) m(6)t(6)A37 methyltransferase TsaA